MNNETAKGVFAYEVLFVITGQHKFFSNAESRASARARARERERE